MSHLRLSKTKFSLTRQYRIKALVAGLIVSLIGSTFINVMGISQAFAQTSQNTTWQYQYDAQGNLTQIADPLGHITNQSYDSLNRLLQQVQPVPVAGQNSPIINYTYDGISQAQSVTDPRSLKTSYTTDGLGNTTTLSSPDTGSTINTYDAAGNLKTSKDARNKTTTYSYDALNRLTQISFATGTATLFEYDGGTAPAPYSKGRLTKITDESGNTVYAYDAFGRVLSKVQTAGPTVVAVSYTYGSSGLLLGKLASVTYPSLNRINYGYDSAGRINSITLNPTSSDGNSTNTAVTINLLTNIAYQSFGAVKSWTWGNSVGYARTFDLDGRITAYPLGVTNGVYRFVGYDAASRVTEYDDWGAGGAIVYQPIFGYDNLDRLTSFVSAATSQSYGYDATGNRTNATIGASTYTYTTAPTSNRLSSTTGPVPAKTNTYDAAGNLTGDGTVTYAYSDRGRRKSSTKTGNTVSYFYNGLGQRVMKSGATIATNANYYVYDEQGQLISEFDNSYNGIQETVYLGNLPVAVLKQYWNGSTLNTNVYYIYADQINTPRAIVRASDNLMVWRWDGADPFGNTPPNENPSNLGASPVITYIQPSFTYNPRFPGQLYDKETGLHYNYFRDYDPALGRYTESDPIGLQGGINTYGYVEDQPTMQVDPLGLMGSRGNPCRCPKSPPGPPGACVKDNIEEAKKHWDPEWYKKQMGAGRPWDYKKKGSQYEDFGNFNYGAVGASYGGIGLPGQVLKRYAGWYEENKTPKAYDSSNGHWWGSSPYGDYPTDQYWIQKGIEYARCGCGG